MQRSNTGLRPQGNGTTLRVVIMAIQRVVDIPQVGMRDRLAENVVDDLYEAHQPLGVYK
jgi:hypothetical protein